MATDGPVPNISPRKLRQSKPRADAFFGPRGLTKAPPSSAIPSSTPAFGTPVHPIKPFNVSAAAKPAILPIHLTPASLRPLAFRTFTKKHSLTLASLALQELASLFGRYCGSVWRDDG